MTTTSKNSAPLTEADAQILIDRAMAACDRARRDANRYDSKDDGRRAADRAIATFNKKRDAILARVPKAVSHV